jgi:hypothetical protein
MDTAKYFQEGLAECFALAIKPLRFTEKIGLFITYCKRKCLTFATS